MVTLSLRSVELEELAESLLAIADHLGAQGAERAQSWNQLAGFTNADSLLLGIQQLHRHNGSCCAPSNA